FQPSTGPVDVAAAAQAMIPVESGRSLTAKNPNSSATGPGQFIDRTWIAEMKKLHPEWANQTDAFLLALRTDPKVGMQLAQEATVDYAKSNATTLQQNNIPVNPTTLYASHYLGPDGAVKVLNAPDGTPMTDLVSAKVYKANPDMW